MIGFAEFPNYETVRDTYPVPPPEDDGSELHTLTLDGAQEAIAVLKEQVRDQIEIIRILDGKLEASNKREREHLETIRQLETTLNQLQAERR